MRKRESEVTVWMVTGLCVVLAIVLSSGPLWAQESATRALQRAERYQQWVDQTMQRLNVTPDQKPKVEAIFKEQNEKMQEVRAKYQGQGREGFEKSRGEMDAVREATKKKLAKVLTEKQMEEYAKLQEERRGPGGMRPAPEVRRATP